jgi:NADPH:quinone reductase and related Zn-dependent oxidoreductases
MKAFIVDRYGSADRVRASEVPDPEMREDDVLIEIHAAGVNPLDSKIRDGEFKLLLPYRLPLILGNELAGVVSEWDLACGDSSPATRCMHDLTRTGSGHSRSSSQ